MTNDKHMETARDLLIYHWRVDDDMVSAIATALADAEREGREKALEEAAQIADPPLMHRKGKPGLWRRRRAQIAADIRALKGTAKAEGRKVEASE